MGKRAVELRWQRAIVVGGLALILASSASAQPRLNAGPLPLTAEQIVTVAGSEADAAEVVGFALQSTLRILARREDGTIFVLASQLRAEWLSAVPRVRWVRLSDADALAHYERCGRLLLIRSITPSQQEGLKLSVSEGNRCSSTSQDYNVVRRAGHWGAAAGLLGGGYGGIHSDCGCP
jgi:hypothetical protein